MEDKGAYDNRTSVEYFDGSLLAVGLLIQEILTVFHASVSERDTRLKTMAYAPFPSLNPREYI